MSTQLTELRHLAAGPLYIACADWNFAWLPEELAAFKRLWADGVDLPGLAERLGRPDYEVALLVMDLAERGEIEGRGGVEGRSKARGTGTGKQEGRAGRTSEKNGDGNEV